MGSIAGGSAGLGILGLALGGGTSWLSLGNQPPKQKVVSATENDAMLQPWPSDDDASIFTEGVIGTPNCSFWSGNAVFTSPYCSHFAVSRVAVSISQRAMSRATRCASFYTTECVVGPEIGLSLPSAFIYHPDDASKMRMIIAPRILSHESEKKNVKVFDPSDGAQPQMERFNTSIRAQFLEGGSRVPVEEVFHGAEAYCIQLLRRVFSESCWAQLD